MSKAKDLLDQADEHDLRETIKDAMSLPEELHTHPEVGHIAGIGELHPERLTDPQIQTLCGEVMRHIRRMKGEG